MHSESLQQIGRLAADQWGIVTTAQAAALGIHRVALARLVERGLIEHVTTGVYAFLYADTSPRSSLHAAWLALDPAKTARQRTADLTSAGVVSHASAAQVHELGTLLADEHHFTYPTRKQTVRPGIRLHRRPLAAEDVVLVDGLPVTTPERTIADLVFDGVELEHVSQVVGDAAQKGVVDVAALAVLLDPLARRNDADSGAELVQRLLDQAGYGRAAIDPFAGSGALSDSSVRFAVTVLQQIQERVAAVAQPVIENLQRYIISPEYEQSMRQVREIADMATGPSRETVESFLRALNSPAMQNLQANLQLAAREKVALDANRALTQTREPEVGKGEQRDA